jgi:polyhydroxyalkanoate synthesis regulator protein
MCDDFSVLDGGTGAHCVLVGRLSGRADRALREPILVKRYDGARRYDTAKARYVSVEELCGWCARDIPFEVREADTGADVSQVLLA